MVASTNTGILNVNQVYQLLLNNGATQKEAATLAGISVFEAGGGNPNAINSQVINDNARTQDYSVGLFQYNFRAGNFNPSNPLSSSRGGYTPTQLLGDLNSQAQSALALLRGSASGYGNWTTYGAYFGQIQNYVNQLLGTSTGGTTDTTPTDTGVNPTTTVNPTVGTQSTTNAGGVPPPTGLNLSFGGSIQHIIFQFLLVLFGIALLLGGVYLIGSHK